MGNYLKNIQRPSDMLMYLSKTNDKEENNELVIVINSGLKLLYSLFRSKNMPKQVYNNLIKHI